MADNDKSQNPAGAPDDDAQVFKIQRIYLKDVSYESPQSPAVFIGNTSWQPNVSLHLNTESTKLENDLYESVLAVTATVKLEETTAYLIEVKQAGLFLIRGFEQETSGSDARQFFAPICCSHLPARRLHRWCKKAAFRSYCLTLSILMPCTPNMLKTARQKCTST